MDPLAVAALLLLLVFLASVISVEAGLSVAIIEILAGVMAGNVFGIHGAPWFDFLAQFGSILLTLLASTEVDPGLLRRKLGPSLLLGGGSFLAPFLAVAALAAFSLHWSPRASLIAGCALSTTSLAVVYAVLVETGLNASDLGKLIMAATFVTDIGTALALSILFIVPGTMTAVFFLARQHMPGAATYTTLLMSTGLTFGTISSLYGLQAGFIDRAQFSVLVTVVIASAVVPTVIAQRWFRPRLSPEQQEEVLAREEEGM